MFRVPWVDDNGQVQVNRGFRVQFNNSIGPVSYTHLAMLKGAGEKLADALESVEIHDIKVPYITNVTADYVKSPTDVKDYLTKQVSSSVRWQQTIERLIADGADEFVEIGPGRSLLSLIHIYTMVYR